MRVSWDYKEYNRRTSIKSYANRFPLDWVHNIIKPCHPAVTSPYNIIISCFSHLIKNIDFRLFLNPIPVSELSVSDSTPTIIHP